ncbi:hypothetical protein B484DRAFT_407159 [Ochromonadaceae sp. CCMP2298]|nr:hypothetical protein B484DRAFT_407159 [Ochromonadaceae sp. CCMP2298]
MTILWASLACLCLLGAEGFSHPRSLIRPRSRALGIPVGNAVAGTAARVGSSALQAFHSAIGVDSDLHAAVKQAVDAAAQDVADPTVVAFFVSSIYDGAFPYSLIFDYIKQHLPSVKYVLGCTTGCPIATGPLNEPVEVEARSSISVLMGRTAGEGIEASLFNLSPEQMKAYITQEQGQSLGALSGVSKAEGGVALILATESSKRNLAAFLTILEEREGIKGVGGVASSVTSLHQPKVFYSVAGVGTGAGSWEGGFERLSHGLAGLMLTGDIAVQTVVARSCLPVGPMFQVTKTDKNEVLEMKKYVPGLGLEELADTSDGQLSPLVHLDNVLKALPGEQAFSLKKELLVGAVPRTAAEVAEEGYLNM